MDELCIPPSPTYQSILDMFTTLNDDGLTNLCSRPPHAHQTSPAIPVPQGSLLDSSSIDNTPGNLSLEPHVQPRAQPQELYAGGKAKKKQRPKIQENIFCSATGKVVKRERKRSAFTKERRREVTHIRDIGACLRCRIRKIPVSSGSLFLYGKLSS